MYETARQPPGSKIPRFQDFQDFQDQCTRPHSISQEWLQSELERAIHDLSTTERNIAALQQSLGLVQDLQTLLDTTRNMGLGDEEVEVGSTESSASETNEVTVGQSNGGPGLEIDYNAGRAQLE